MAIAAFAVAFVAGLCGIGHDCTRSDNMVTATSLGACLLAFFGAPAAASLVTKRWWWSTITMPIPATYLGYLLASGPAVASVYQTSAFLVAMSVLDIAVVSLVIASRKRRATRRSPQA